MGFFRNISNLFKSVDSKLDRIGVIESELETLRLVKDLLIDQYENISKALSSEDFTCKNEIKLTDSEYLKQMAQLKLRERSLFSELDILKSNNKVSDQINNNNRFKAIQIIKSLYREGKLSLDKYNEVAAEKDEDGAVKYADVIVVNDQWEILLLKRSVFEDKHKGAWVIPGGHVDKDENYETAGRRELREESGISVDNLLQDNKINPEDWNEVLEFKDENAHIFYYCLNIHDKKNIEILLDEQESRDYKWVPREELVNYPMIFDMRDHVIEAMGWGMLPGLSIIEKAFILGVIPEEIFEKARKGIYSDTEENRRLKRVGMRYGDFHRVQEINHYIQKDKQNQELDIPFQRKLDFIEKELKRHGVEIDGVSKSSTLHGKSWYIKIKSDLIDAQIRLSDHEVGDRRFMNDPTLSYINYTRDDRFIEDSIVNSVLQLRKLEKVKIARNAQWEAVKREGEKIELETKSFINSLKAQHKAIFNSNKTYQTLEEIKEKHPDWEYIHQNKNNGGFDYDYIKEQNGHGQYHVSKDYYYYLKQENLLDNTIEKARGHKYLRKEKRNGKDIYIYNEPGIKSEKVDTSKEQTSPGIKQIETLVSITSGKQRQYFEAQLANAKPIVISKMSDVLTPKEIKSLSYFPLQVKQCYYNAYKLCGIPGVKYVEGFAMLFGSLPIDHAWNERDGKYFDVTAEIVLKDNSGFTNYTSYLELDGDESNKYAAETGLSGPWFREWFIENKGWDDDITKNMDDDIQISVRKMTTLVESSLLSDEVIEDELQKQKHVLQIYR